MGWDWDFWLCKSHAHIFIQNLCILWFVVPKITSHSCVLYGYEPSRDTSRTINDTGTPVEDKKRIFVWNTRFFWKSWDDMGRKFDFCLIFHFLDGMGIPWKSHKTYDIPSHGMGWEGMEKAIPCSTLISRHFKWK